MPYLLFLEKRQNLDCGVLQVIDGALWVIRQDTRNYLKLAFNFNIPARCSLECTKYSLLLTIKAPITTAADGNFCNIFLNFQKNKV